MTSPRDPDRLIQQFLLEGQEQLHDQIYDAVRASIERKRQRVVIGPWRMPSMNKLVPIGLGVAVVVAIVAIGIQLLGPAPSSGVGASSSAAPTAIPIGGTVQFQSDGIPATTEVDAVADGASVSGTAVTTFGTGTHTVRLECTARDGDTWAFAGTTEQATVPGERAGEWSAVVVKDGPPQRIGIWLSDAKSDGIDCRGWLAAVELSTIDAHNFMPVESGTLVPPPDSAP